MARGYNELSVKYHLANMANRSRLQVLKGEYKPAPKLVVPLVSSLHPATTILSQVVKSTFTSALSMDPVLEVVLPPSSFIVSYTRLPNLQLLLCPNDQNKLATTRPSDRAQGYANTAGCHCKVCQASLFSKWISPPSMPGFQKPPTVDQAPMSFTTLHATQAGESVLGPITQAEPVLLTLPRKPWLGDGLITKATLTTPGTSAPLPPIFFTFTEERTPSSLCQSKSSNLPLTWTKFLRRSGL